MIWENIISKESEMFYNFKVEILDLIFYMLSNMEKTDKMTP